MKKEALKVALLREKKKYMDKSFEELIQIDKPIIYECGAGEDWYQVEVQLLEKTNEYVHISVAVDDGKMLGFMFPLSDSFILYKNGKKGDDPKR